MLTTRTPSLRIMAKKPIILIIRDGWGINPGGPATAERDGNATLLAKTLWLHESPLRRLSVGAVERERPRRLIVG